MHTIENIQNKTKRVFLFICVFLLLCMSCNNNKILNQQKEEKYCLVNVKAINKKIQQENIGNVIFYFFYVTNPEKMKKIASNYSKLIVLNSTLKKYNLDNTYHLNWKISNNLCFPNFFLIGFFISDETYSAMNKDNLLKISNKLLYESVIKIYSQDTGLLNDTIIIKRYINFKQELIPDKINFDVNDTLWQGCIH